VEVQLDVVQQRQVRGLLLELELERQLLERQDELLELELELQQDGPRWLRRNRQRLSQVSSWHHASTVRWYRFSRPSRLCRCASCRWFVHQQRMQAPRRPTTSPLCSVFSWSSS
jgi:hypothetical protein